MSKKELIQFIDELIEWLGDDRIEQKHYEELINKYSKLKEEDNV